MKPRNEREREVVRLSRKLNVITDAKHKWAVENVIPHVIYTAGKSCWCSVCGGAFEVKGIGETHECPHCHRVSKVEKSRKSVVRDFRYLQVITTCKGWQVVEYILFRWEIRKGGKMNAEYMKVLEKWCRPGQPTVTLGSYLKMCPYWQEQPYSPYSYLSVKIPSHFHSEWMEVSIYPRKVILPTYGRCGYTDKMFETYTAEDIFANMFSVPHFETLFKGGEIEELHKKMDYSYQYQKYWPSVRVALRHGFDPYKKVKYLSNYWDYLSMLSYLHKDMRSPHYVAPKDWGSMHRQIVDEANRKRERIQLARLERERIRRAQYEEEQLKLAKEAKKSFEERIKKFAGLVIVGDGLSIVPLMSIQEFADEGKAMHHCVFSNGYYKKPDSLILSAKDDEGHRVETIEVSISEGKVLQSHGVNNLFTERHEYIVDLVTKNIPVIRKMSGVKVRARA